MQQIHKTNLTETTSGPAGRFCMTHFQHQQATFQCFHNIKTCTLISMRMHLHESIGLGSKIMSFVRCKSLFNQKLSTKDAHPFGRVHSNLLLARQDAAAGKQN